MKTSLAHLPQRKQDALAAIAAAIREMTPAEMVILFGSHARGDWVDDPKTGYRSDYDLLAIVESPELVEQPRLWSTVEVWIKALAAPTPVALLVHDIAFVNTEISRGQYFFSDIHNDGVLLYTSKRFDLSSPKVRSKEERRALAEQDFEHWFTSAGRFYRSYEDNLERAWLNEAAFLLHHATERYYVAALLVLLAYKPRTHDIEELGKLAGRLSPELKDVLPVSTEQDDRLFKLLKRAYIEPGYSKGDPITAEELTALGERVRALGERVERVCHAHITSLGPATPEPPSGG